MLSVHYIHIHIVNLYLRYRILSISTIHVQNIVDILLHVYCICVERRLYSLYSTFPFICTFTYSNVSISFLYNTVTETVNDTVQYLEHWQHGAPACVGRSYRRASRRRASKRCSTDASRGLWCPSQLQSGRARAYAAAGRTQCTGLLKKKNRKNQEKKFVVQ